jgi:hypothetical protein
MPQAAAAAIGAIVGAVGTATAAVGVGAAKFGLSLGLSTGAAKAFGAAAVSAFKLAGISALAIASNALFAPSIGATGAPTDWTSDPNAGVPFIAGRLGVGGNLVYSREFGQDNRYLGNITVYSGAGPVQSLGALYADGVLINFDGNGKATSGGNIANNMWLVSQLGAQPEATAIPSPAGLDGGATLVGWTANHKLSGFGADMQVLRQDSKFKTYPAGQPRRWRIVEGIKVYDPRLDSTYPGGDGACRLNDRSTYVYTANPILHALNWCIGYYANGKPIGGLADPAGPTLDGIDVAAFVSAANVAEANSWTLGARYSTADDKHQVLLAMLQAGGALYAENAGRISCVSRGAVKSSVMTLGRADTAGPVSIDTMPPRRVVINSLIPKCVLEAHEWEAVDLDPVTVADLVTSDGDLRRRGKSYPMVTNGVQASQLAALDILDAREPLSGSASFKPYVRDLKPGDAFTWDEPGYLLDGVKCVVMERSYDPATDRVEITWRSETDGKIAYALGLDPALPAYPGLTPGNPSFVPVPSTDDWTATGGSIGNPGFVEGPVITLDGDVADLTGVTHVLVDFRETGATAWTHHGEFPLAGFSREQILGLLPNKQYDIRLRYRNAWGVIDDAQSLIFSAVGTGDQVVAKALDAISIDGRPAEEFDALLSLAVEGSEETALILLEEALDRVERDQEVEDEAVNLIAIERTARISADEAVQTTLTTQISAVGDSVAVVQGEVTTVANNLAAETTTRTTQISTINGNISSINTELSTLTTATSSNATAITTLQGTVTSQGNTLSSTVTTVASVSSTLEERTAAYVIAAQAGDGFAGIGFFARDDGGTPTSDVRIATQRLGFGATFDDPRIFLDAPNVEFFMINAAGTVKTLQAEGAENGRLRLRRADGTLTYDSDNGGVQVDGLPNTLFTQGPAETVARVGTGALDTDWLDVAEVNLNSLPGGGRFVCDFACTIGIKVETTAFQPASGEVRIIAVQGASTEQIGAVATWTQDYMVVPPDDDGPTLYRATTSPVQSTRVMAQPFTGNVVFKMQARRTDSFGSGAGATVSGVYLSARRTP